MPPPPAAGLKISDADRQQVRAISRHCSTARGIVLRIDIMLGAAEGLANGVLARKLGHLGADCIAVAEAI